MVVGLALTSEIVQVLCRLHMMPAPIPPRLRLSPDVVWLASGCRTHKILDRLCCIGTPGASASGRAGWGFVLHAQYHCTVAEAKAEATQRGLYPPQSRNPRGSRGPSLGVFISASFPICNGCRIRPDLQIELYRPAGHALASCASIA